MEILLGSTCLPLSLWPCYLFVCTVSTGGGIDWLPTICFQMSRKWMGHISLHVPVKLHSQTQTDLFLPLKWTHFLPFLPATWTFMKVEKEQVHLFLSKEAALIVPEGPVYYQRLVTAVHTCGGVGGSVETNVLCRTQHMVNSKLPNWTVTFSQAELILFAGPEAA